MDIFFALSIDPVVLEIEPVVLVVCEIGRSASVPLHLDRINLFSFNNKKKYFL